MLLPLPRELPPAQFEAGSHGHIVAPAPVLEESGDPSALSRGYSEDPLVQKAAAATTIQAGYRGMLARRQVVEEQERLDEEARATIALKELEELRQTEKLEISLFNTSTLVLANNNINDLMNVIYTLINKKDDFLLESNIIIQNTYVETIDKLETLNSNIIKLDEALEKLKTKFKFNQ